MATTKFYRTKTLGELKVTKRMEKFLQTKVLPNYIIYSQKDKYAFCTACQSEVDINAFKHTKPLLEVKCPSCRAKAFLKAKGQTKNQFTDSGVGIILDKDDDVCVRYFDVVRVYHPDGTVFRYEYWECMREYHNGTGDTVVFNNLFGKGWKKCNIRRYTSYNGRAGEPIIRVNTNWEHRAVYDGNMKTVIKDTAWKYSLMDKIFKLNDIHHYWDTVKIFLSDYIQCPVTEYMYKVGFLKLAEHITFNGSIPINSKGKTIVEMLKLTKDNYKALLKIGNPTFEDLRKYQLMTEYNLNESDWVIWCKYFDEKGNRVYGYYANNYEGAMKQYFKKSWYQFDKYASSTKDFKLSDYTDYLRMCNDLGYDMKNTFIVFPKNLHEAHRNVIAEWNLKKNAKEREKAKARNKEYESFRQKYSELYAFEEDNLKIVVPNGCDEICAEGQNLRHCVGTYIDRVCKGMSVILFVRQITDLAKSYYTMELQGEKMIQVRGFGNCAVTPEVRTFIEDFAKQKNIVMRNIA